jgi:arginase family enzyme
MKKLALPKFKNYQEEANGWDAHMGIVEANLVEAMKNGTAGRGGPERVLRARRESRNITIRIPIVDIERSQVLADKKGIGYQTYMKMLLKEALDRESSLAARRGRAKVR